MNGSIAYINSDISGAALQPRMDKDTAIVCFRLGLWSFIAAHRPNLQVHVSVVAIVSAVLLQFILSRNLECIRKFFANIVATPTKLITFLYLGQIPLRLFGFLDQFSLINVVGVAGFGGLGLSTLYFFHDRFLPMSRSNSLGATEVHDDRDKEIKLDRALQRKITFLLVCEIYHTVIGVVIGVSVMRLLSLCDIDHKHLDLLMTAGLFGPAVFFVLFISLAGVVFGVSWCLHRFYNRWHG